jgi:hypothetical protein
LTQPDGKEICWDIPVLVRKFPGPDPDPDPLIIVGGPTRGPWIRGEGISPEIARTLANMATVVRVTEHLDGALSAMVGKMFVEHVNQMQLPAGAHVTITRQHGA